MKMHVVGINFVALSYCTNFHLNKFELKLKSAVAPISTPSCTLTEATQQTKREDE